MIYEIKAYLTVLCFALSHLQMLWFLQIEGKTLHQQKDHMIFCSGLESYHAKSASTPVSPFFEMESFEPHISATLKSLKIVYLEFSGICTLISCWMLI